MKRKRTVRETDVLIIGSGPAGMWTANRIKQLNQNLSVTVVDKGPIEWGGQMTLAGGDFDAVLPEEDVADWVKDLICYWDGLCEQDVMQTLLETSYQRLEEYQQLGCEFLTDGAGQLKGVPQRGLKHVKLYPAKLKGRGGEDMVKALQKEAARLTVQKESHIFITKLLKREHKISGAAGFNIQTGEMVVFQTSIVVLACGNAGWRPSYGKNMATGEVIKMAMDAGAEVRNFEFNKVWNVPKLFGWEGQTTLMPLGARFVNCKGESFMEQYSSVLGPNTDPHFITIAMAKEALAGNGPIYFDISQIKPEDRGLIQPQTGWQLLNHQKLLDLGIDFFHGKTEWVPQLNECLGGIMTDENGETAVPGLYAAGRSRSLDPGVYIGGFALSTTATTGCLTGTAIVAALEAEEPIVTPYLQEELDDLEREIFAPGEKHGIAPKTVFRKLQELVFPYDIAILKTEQSLKFALQQLELIKQDYLTRMSADDPHYLMKYYETVGTTLVTELYLKASLLRTESRAGHYREDFPYHDDERWLCWLQAKLTGGSLEFEKVPVPIKQYPYPITSFYSDNFTFFAKPSVKNEA